jgi:hypothetical protein
MNGWLAFRTGISRMVHHWQALLIVFAVNLLAALLLATLPALSLVPDLGHRPAIRKVADGVDAWLVVETTLSPFTNAVLEQGGPGRESPPGLQQTILWVLLAAATVPLAAWLPAAFLNGGLLRIYAEADQPFRWRRFFRGCWHWWGMFLLLGVVQGIAFLAILVPGIALGVVAVVAAGGWLAWMVIAGLALVGVFALALIECTRIVAVVEGTRNLLHAFAGAMRFVLRHPLSLAGFYGLALLLAGVLHAGYRLGLMPHLPLDQWLLVLVVQQTFILARLATRLVRLAGGVVLIAHSTLADPDRTRAGGRVSQAFEPAIHLD